MPRSEVRETVPKRGKWKGVPGKYRIVRRKGYTVKRKRIELDRREYQVPEKTIYIRLENLSTETKNVDEPSRIESGP